MADIFVSYTQRDRDSALWIANQLKALGHSPHLHELEVNSGESIVKWMNTRFDTAAHVLCVFSREYRQALYAISEFEAALWKTIDAPGFLLIVVVKRCDLPALALPLKRCDLWGLPEHERSSHFRQFIGNLRSTRDRPIDPPIQWQQYEGLLNLAGYKIAFAPLLNPDWSIEDGFRGFEVLINRNDTPYELPNPFRGVSIDHRRPFNDLASCRLVEYGKKGSIVELTLSKILYSDYLKSHESLDYPLPSDSGRTYRDEFVRKLPQPRTGDPFSLRRFPLTNIIGVGLFVVSKDREVLICRHDASSHVYPSRWTFSASGTIKWGAWPDPFIEVLCKCREETGHQINPSKLELIELGIDARKLFFECCFIENSDMTAHKINEYLTYKSRGTPGSVNENEGKLRTFEWLSLGSLPDFIECIVKRCWEPAAEAMLLMLAIRKHGFDRTVDQLCKFNKDWVRHQMFDEWDLRASRPGSLAVMSERHPSQDIEAVSDKYVNSVMEFIGNDVAEKRVLDVGSGIGRIAERLAPICKEVTCVDFCNRMNDRNRQTIGRKENVIFQECFIQELERDVTYDVAICSLVLIHNVDEQDFEKAVASICACSNEVFVFEDISEREPSISHTRLRSKQILKSEFEIHGFYCERGREFLLFEDLIAFLKFSRKQ